MLMRVYLQRAGYSLQMDGQMTRPDDTKRAEYFNAVISEWEAIQANGYHDFYSGGYEQLFRNFSQDVLNSQESIFEIAFFHQQGARNGGAWGIYNGPSVAEVQGVPTSEMANYMGRANGVLYCGARMA